jgi:hypothetical protein
MPYHRAHTHRVLVVCVLLAPPEPLPLLPPQLSIALPLALMVYVMIAFGRTFICLRRRRLCTYAGLQSRHVLILHHQCINILMVVWCSSLLLAEEPGESMNDHLTVNAVIRTRDPITRIVCTSRRRRRPVFSAAPFPHPFSLVLSPEERSVREAISWCR